MSLVLLGLALLLAIVIFALTVGWLVLERRSESGSDTEAGALPEAEGPEGEGPGAGDLP